MSMNRRVWPEPPLRELSLDDLDRYAYKAMTTWGEVKHFKHFVPRLFEIAAEVPEGFDLEVLFGKLAYAHWQEWPAVERDCVERYLHAFWMFTIQEPPTAECDDRIDTVLCAVGNACPSVQPFLDEWLKSTTAAAVRQLAQWISINYLPIATKGRLRSAYWNGHAPVQIEIIAWLRTREVYEHVARREATLAPWQQTTVGLLDAIRGTGFH